MYHGPTHAHDGPPRARQALHGARITQCGCDFSQRAPPTVHLALVGAPATFTKNRPTRNLARTVFALISSSPPARLGQPETRPNAHPFRRHVTLNFNRNKGTPLANPSVERLGVMHVGANALRQMTAAPNPQVVHAVPVSNLPQISLGGSLGIPTPRFNTTPRSRATNSSRAYPWGLLHPA